MKRIATKAALGLLMLSASLVVSRTASAQAWNRWQNAANRSYYLGVSGGAQCTPGRQCWVNPGTQMITYQLSGLDQRFYSAAPGTGTVQEYYADFNYSGMCVGVAGGSTSNGANLVTWECNGSNDQSWQLKKAEDYGAPYTGCYVFINQNSGQVMGVAGGTVNNGAKVIQWPFYQSPAFHADQFWCPVAP